MHSLLDVLTPRIVPKIRGARTVYRDEPLKRAYSLYGLSGGDAAREAKRRWEKRHRESVYAKQKRWALRNPEKVKERRKKMWEKNGEKYRARSREYYKENAERLRAKKRARYRERKNDRLTVMGETMTIGR